MTNTQSPAPGVAAEAFDRLMLVIEKNCLILTNQRPLVEDAIRTALQASAAAVPVATVLEADALAEMHVALPPGTKLYTAPPLPAQVQEAEVSGEKAYHDGRGAYELATLKTGAPGFHDLHVYEKAFWVATAALASRTPAPGMAGGVNKGKAFEDFCKFHDLRPTERELTFFDAGFMAATGAAEGAEPTDAERWIPFKDKMPPEDGALDNPDVKAARTVLVTNNLSARDRMGRMSHVWFAMPLKSTDGSIVAYDTDGRKIHGLTHWLDPMPTIAAIRAAQKG